MNSKIILLLLLFSVNNLFGQISAITQDGKKVMLFEDNTWKYADCETKPIRNRVFNIDIDTIGNAIIDMVIAQNKIAISDGRILAWRLSNDIELSFKGERISNLSTGITNIEYYKYGSEITIGKLKTITTENNVISFAYNTYGEEYNKGKIKSISTGTETIYFNYNTYGEEYNKGKIKSISVGTETVYFNYNTFGEEYNKGKMKSISQYNQTVYFDYYANSTNSLKGKLKSMNGNINGISVNYFE